MIRGLLRARAKTPLKNVFGAAASRGGSAEEVAWKSAWGSRLFSSERAEKPSLEEMLFPQMQKRSSLEEQLFPDPPQPEKQQQQQTQKQKQKQKRPGRSNYDGSDYNGAATKEMDHRISGLLKRGQFQDALKVLEDLVETTKPVDSNDSTPLIYHGVLQNFFQALVDRSPNHPEAAPMTEELLRLEYRLLERGRIQGDPDRHFGWAIAAWASSGLPEAGERAHRILEEGIIRHAETNAAHEEPTEVEYTNVMKAYIGTGELEKAKRIFQNMPTPPSIITYTMLMVAYDKVGNVDEMDELLRRYAEQTGSPDALLPNRVLNQWSRVASTRTDAIERMEQIYQLVDKRDVYTYNHRLNTYANARDPHGAEWAFQDILVWTHQDPENFPPIETAQLNTVLKAWMRCDDPDRLENALGIMEDVRQRGEEQLGFRLDRQSYNLVMMEMAELALPLEATRLFQTMVLDHQSGNERAKPTTNTFNIWLRSFGNAKESIAGQQAEVVLGIMMEHEVQPDKYTWMAAIKCWRATRDQSEKENNEAVFSESVKRIKELKEILEETERLERLRRAA